MPPLQLPTWIHMHLFDQPNIHSVPEELMEQVRLGLSRFRTSKPKVSIVMPVFNEEAGLLRTLSSLSQLKLPFQMPTELLLINDGSTDRTQELMDRLEVRSIRLLQNKRQKVSRWVGLQQARGKIVLHADADTLYPPSWGADFVQVLEQDAEVSMVYGPHAFVPGAGKGRLPYVLHEHLGQYLYQIRRRHRPHINVHGFNSALRRDQALQFGSYDHDVKGSEDGHMALLLHKVGKLRYVGGQNSLVWTSDRRIQGDGGLTSAFLKRLQKEGSRLPEYLMGRRQSNEG